MDHSPPLAIDRGTGLLQGASYQPSPNRDFRPPGASLDLIVVHGISLPPGQFTGTFVEDFFHNRLEVALHPFFRTIESLRVSAHAYVRRDGRIVQFVPFHERAWHAGKSLYRYRDACNDFSVGIELEGSDDVAYEAAQYTMLAALILALRRAYPTIRADAIVGHSDIAPGRKTDPGPVFEWSDLRRRLDATGAVASG
jgi:AmpD protein